MNSSWVEGVGKVFPIEWHLAKTKAKLISAWKYLIENAKKKDINYTN